MNRPGAETTTNEQRRDAIFGSVVGGHGMPCPDTHLGGEGWSFVYGFFSNGTPFDAPNRSEPCPPSH